MAKIKKVKLIQKEIDCAKNIVKNNLKLPPFGTKRTGEKSREVGREIRKKFLEGLEKLKQEYIQRIEDDPAGAGSWARFDNPVGALTDFIGYLTQNAGELLR